VLITKKSKSLGALNKRIYIIFQFNYIILSYCSKLLCRVVTVARIRTRISPGEIGSCCTLNTLGQGGFNLDLASDKIFARTSLTKSGFQKSMYVTYDWKLFGI
jgi:hypothetical protein